ncbi:hypothetical protein D3C87_2198340 [compost metagenome]
MTARPMEMRAVKASMSRRSFLATKAPARPISITPPRSLGLILPVASFTKPSTVW